MKRLLAIACLLAFPAVCASAPFEPGVPYYFEHFDPALKPWDPGQDLNIEEVFKNYVYYEVLFDKAGRGITVNRYVQNRKERSDRYLICDDGGLQPK